MTLNKKRVAEYMHSYNELDHARILACLTDDIEWVCPGAFHLKGKAAFDKEIENPAFEGKPHIIVTRMMEENDIVIAEGTVKTKLKEKPAVLLMFCDVFEMQNGKIRKLTSYLAPSG